MPADRANPRHLFSTLLAAIVALAGVAGAVPMTSAAGDTAALSRTAAHSGLVPGTVNRTSVNLEATYAVNLAVRFGDGALRVKSMATITNTSGGPIDRVELNTVAAVLGSMALDRVSVNNRIVRATASDQTIVVPLGGVLEPGATVGVEVILHATLRTTTSGSNWLFTRSSGIIDLYRVIPWVSLRHPFGRANQGDPFVTPTSPRVDLVLVTDRPMTAAINAQRLAVSAGGKTQSFAAENVRDLPIVLSPTFHVERSTLGRTEILVYAPTSARASELMTNARHALWAISPLLGAYPWPRFIVAATPGGYPMEGPGTIWIPPAVTTANLPYIVAHETAHQWTPGLVGSDQWADPFADEAVADMVARHVVGLHRASRCARQRLDLPITAYSSACYYDVIYIQGGNWLDSLRTRMGDAVYWRGLRAYIRAHRWGIAGTRALLEALDDATPLNVAALAKPDFPGDS